MTEAMLPNRITWYFTCPNCGKEEFTVVDYKTFAENSRNELGYPREVANFTRRFIPKNWTLELCDTCNSIMLDFEKQKAEALKTRKGLFGRSK